MTRTILFLVALAPIGCGKDKSATQTNESGGGAIGTDEPEKRKVAPAVSLPRPDKEGQEWTHRDLFNFLKKAGLPASMKPGLTGAVWISLRGSDSEAESDYALMETGYFPTTLLICWKERDNEDAREAAGKFQIEAFAWGRFWFRSRREDTMKLNDVHTALTGKPLPTDQLRKRTP